MKQAERIYHDAIEEFGNNSYEATSIEAICQRHSISKG